MLNVAHTPLAQACVCLTTALMPTDFITEFHALFCTLNFAINSVHCSKPALNLLSWYALSTRTHSRNIIGGAPAEIRRWNFNQMRSDILGPVCVPAASNI